jgi:hypothetical protein
VFAIGLNVYGFKRSRERWIFKGHKISSMTCFRVEVKLSAPCYKILWPEYVEYDKRYFTSKITGHFSPSFSMLHY